jgi:alpha-L-arabinofuranosidase
MHPHAATTDPIVIDVDGNHVTGSMTTTSLGVGVAVWDQHMTDDAIPALLRNVGYGVIRYPGGSYSDLYHWKTASATKGLDFTANIQPKTDFDSFMGIVRNSHATPLITVNYGSNQGGTGGAEPSEAADWVRYANKEKHYGVKYWEIGNEIYGNGFYNGQPWEIDFHAPRGLSRSQILHNPNLGPDVYGANVAKFSQAMKAVDPSVKIGAVLTFPGAWPDGQQPSWNDGVLSKCVQDIDFVVVHWYPASRSLTDLDKVPGPLKRLRELVDHYSPKRHLAIWMTEGNTSGNGMQLIGALFAADHFLTWWENGADNVDWWDMHNGLSAKSATDYDDSGMLSSGMSSNGVVQPAANTPFPPYFGTLLASKVAQPGDKFVSVSEATATLKVHAVRKSNGQLGLLIINEDPNNSADVRIDVSGFTPGENGTRYDLNQDGLGISKSSAGSLGEDFTLTVRANSACAIVTSSR